MMRIMSAVLIVILLAIASPVQSQDTASDTIFAYTTYFECTPDRESRADEIIASSYKPHYDQAVEQEQILSWSWMQHYIGGKWRRMLVVVTNELDVALETSGALGEIISDRTPEAGRAFSEICSSHDDYMWQSIPGIGGGPASAQRGTATFSTYMQCSLAEEDRADELVRTVLAPVYDAHVGDGKLMSWNWLKQTVGGEYTRLLTLGAEDHESLLRARADIETDLKARKVQRAMREFLTICHTQSDYMWDLYLETS